MTTTVVDGRVVFNLVFPDSFPEGGKIALLYRSHVSCMC